AATGRETACLRGSDSEIWSVAFARDGALLAAGAHNGSIRIWATSGGEPALLRGHEGTVWSLAFTPDGQRLGSYGSVDRTVRTWDGHSGACLEVVPDREGIGEVAPWAAGPARFPWRAVQRGGETAIEAAGGEASWLPLPLARIVTHPSGRAWAGIDPSQLYFAERSRPVLFRLEH